MIYQEQLYSYLPKVPESGEDYGSDWSRCVHRPPTMVPSTGMPRGAEGFMVAGSSSTMTRSAAGPARPQSSPAGCRDRDRQRVLRMPRRPAVVAACQPHIEHAAEPAGKGPHCTGLPRSFEELRSETGPAASPKSARRQVRTFTPSTALRKNARSADRAGLTPGGQRPEASWIIARRPAVRRCIETGIVDVERRTYLDRLRGYRDRMPCGLADHVSEAAGMHTPIETYNIAERGLQHPGTRPSAALNAMLRISDASVESWISMLAT